MNRLIWRAPDRARVALARQIIAAVVTLWAAITPVVAHEIRPAYLELVELSGGRVEVSWQLPALGEMRLALRPRLPDTCRDAGSRGFTRTAGAIVERWIADCGAAGLVGRTIGIEGLQATITDALVRITFTDGTTTSALLRPSQPSFVVAGREAARTPAWGYLRLGGQHILLGADHLLFVLGLLVIVGRQWSLLFKTISAFTLAHSLTLGLATLGLVRVSGPPLNVAIALSIFFLGVEIVRQRRGGTSLTIERPWAAAFGFGLLHGLGFASGLSTLGLSGGELVAALLLFNVGVEIGQLGFVALYLAMNKALDMLEVEAPRWTEAGPGYVVGSLGAYWTMVQAVALMGVRL